MIPCQITELDSILDKISIFLFVYIFCIQNLILWIINFFFRVLFFYLVNFSRICSFFWSKIWTLFLCFFLFHFGYETLCILIIIIIIISFLFIRLFYTKIIKKKKERNLLNLLLLLFEIKMWSFFLKNHRLFKTKWTRK